MSSQPPLVADPAPRPTVSVADEVWIATALLHREHPDREAFTAREITDRARLEAITPQLRPGVYVHAIQHCVANRPPNPGRLRMLYATSRSQRRLYRPGDAFDPRRGDARSLPERGALPSRYRPLLDWYASEFAPTARVARAPQRDPILGLRGLGAELWSSESADRYVARLRRGWK